MVRHAKRPHRRYRRRRRGNRKVATVGTVKRMFARKVETKQTVLYPGDLAMANRYVYCYRPLYNIAKGTNANERLGSSISNVNVRMALAYTHLGLNSTGDTRLSTGSLFRVMVVKSLRDLSGVATSATVWSSITASAPGDNLHLISDSRQPASSLLDPATDTRLVKQFWLRASNPTTALISGDTVFKQLSFNIPKFDYDESAGTARSAWNYYVLVVCQSSKDVGLGHQTGTLQSQFLIRWKDA